MSLLRRLVISIIAVIVLLIAGTTGYSLIGGWGFLDSLYMTVITISTVGFKEVYNLSASGQVFTIILIICSIGTVAYAFSSIISFVVEGSLNTILKERRVSKVVERLNGHYIICGAGQAGRHAMQILHKARVPFVVIEKNKDKCEELLEQKVLVINGDATQDEVLEKAGIKRAKAVIAAMNDDADNVFTVLSCRQLNNAIYIVSRAVEIQSETKLIKAGADAVVSPNMIEGQRLAALDLKPAIISFLDIVHNQGEEEITINIQEVKISPESCLVGLNQKEANIRQKTGLTILGVLSGENKIFNPPLELVFQAHDILLAFGTDEQVARLKEFCTSCK